MRGQLVENRIVIWDIPDSRRLFSQGYYGKPIGMPKPKPDEIDAPLILDLMEGFYLLEIGKISVYRDRTRLDSDAMRDICDTEYHEFEKKYAVYRYFRERNYVINTGIKFGCDFAVYERGPGIDHAPYLVQVYSKRDTITATSAIQAGRLATTVRKQFILAMPRGKSGVDFLALDWWRA